MAEDMEQPNGAPARTPPYVGFKTFGTFIEDLKTNGLPPQIDRSVLKRFSGGVGSQLIVANKSLGLVDDDNRPTERLARLVETHGTGEYKDALRAVLQFGYPFLAKMDLKTATPTMFAEAFRNNTSAKEEVLRKCRTFYLHAAEAAGIEIGPRLLSGGGRAASNGGGRKREAAPKSDPKPKAKTNGTGDGHGPRVDNPVAQDFRSQLLNKFPEFDPSWPDDVKAKWFDGFERLMASAGKAS